MVATAPDAAGVGDPAVAEGSVLLVAGDAEAAASDAAVDVEGLAAA